jgi:hypothetical protein
MRYWKTSLNRSMGMDNRATLKDTFGNILLMKSLASADVQLFGEEMDGIVEELNEVLVT